MMNNVFAQGGGIQKVVAVQPAFTVSLERRILVTPDGQKIDFFLEQNKIADAIDNTIPMKTLELSLPQYEDSTDLIAQLGGGVGDEISVQTHVSGIKITGVYVPEGGYLPDEDGWFSTKSKVATAEQAGTYDFWYHVNYVFTPYYGGPGKSERVLSKDVTIRYQKNAAGDSNRRVDPVKALGLYPGDLLRPRTHHDFLIFFAALPLELLSGAVRLLADIIYVFHEVHFAVHPAHKGALHGLFFTFSCCFSQRLLHRSVSVSSELSLSRILRSARRNSRPLTPAPTAASVIARSGDSMSTQITHITEL
jgi:hypothetical protein